MKKLVNDNLIKKVGNAAKWSSITEIFTKLISPVTTMILARILAPEAFGVVVTVTMVTSFVEMFTDAGFQKYLIQHEFKNNDDKDKNTNVAFLTNFAIAIFLWGIIIIFRNPISKMVGNEGLGNVIAIACLQLPISSFSSIQMALYKRNLEFKTLFTARMINAFLSSIITIPLAVLGLGYWSIIIGSLCGQMSNAVILTIKSKWKASLFYSFSLLKKMLSFSIWSLIEAISIWLTSWIDAFIIGSSLSVYYLGLYKSSINLVNGIMGIITAAITPILFSALSRLQNDEKAFQNMFFNVQKIIAYLVLPIGVGVYIYRNLATQIMLGSRWSEASDIIGIWALTSSVMIVLSHLSSEVYRAKGKPKLSFLVQILHLIFLVPTCIISLKFGFWCLVYSRNLIRIESILVSLIVMQFVFHISVKKILKNVAKPMLCTAIMGTAGFYLQTISEGILWNIVSILICIILYGGLLMLLSRKEIINLISIFSNKPKAYLNNN